MKVKLGTYQEADYKKYTADGTPTWELDVPNLSDTETPKVSLVTITKNRSHLVSIMLYNWNQLRYPEDKLEWIIVDDSDTDSLRYYLPLIDDERIKYYYTKPFDNIAEKRNHACELATGEYIAFMDDDDYYFPDHIMAKVRILKHYKKEGVHSFPVAVYDIVNDDSFVYNWTSNSGMQSNAISEASIMFKKSYWEKHPFFSDKQKGIAEGVSFVGRRFKDWIKVHFLFNFISITHKHNVTNDSRRIDDLYKHKTPSTGDFKTVFPETFMYILDRVKSSF